MVVFKHLGNQSKNVFLNGVRAKSTAASPNDIVIVSALRTPIGKAKRGSFKVS